MKITNGLNRLIIFVLFQEVGMEFKDEAMFIAPGMRSSATGM